MDTRQDIAVLRNQLFTLRDGTPVIQREGDRVQELLTGHYRHFNPDQDFGEAITNYQLAQLRVSGRVQRFNQNYVWINPLPSGNRLGQRRIKQGYSQEISKQDESRYPRAPMNTQSNDPLAKLVILALPSEDERQAFSEMFDEMDIEVKQASSAIEALEFLEDYEANLLLMDIDLPDMHAWQLLGKVREIERLRELPIMIIADHPSMGNAIAKVNYLLRPISIARLRQIVQATLKN